MATIQGTVFYGPESPNGAKDGDAWRNQTTGELRYFAGGAWQPGDSVDTAPVVITGTASPQLQVGYDASNYMTVAVASNGATTLNAVGAGQAFAFSDAVTVTGTITSTTGAFVGGANLTLDATGTGTITLGGTSTGAITLTRATTLSAGGTLNGNLALNGASIQAQFIDTSQVAPAGRWRLVSNSNAMLLQRSTAGTFSSVTSAWEMSAADVMTVAGGVTVTAGTLTMVSGSGYISMASRFAGGNNGQILFNNSTGQNLVISETASNVFGIGTAVAGGALTLTSLSLNHSTGMVTAPLGLTVTAGGATITAGNVAVGGATLPQVGIRHTGTSLSGNVEQYSVLSQATYSSAATTAGYGMKAYITTAAAAFTMVGAYPFYAQTPILGSGSAITNSYGFYTDNQGTSGVTNAYGVYIAAQSGAATLNIGLYNAGTSSLVGAVTMSSTLASGTHTVTGALNASTGIAVGATYSSGNGVFVQNASTNNAISTASQGAATTTLYIGNTAITVVSDVRLKRDITPTTIDALDLIGRLKVVDYTWDDPSDAAPVNKNSRGRWTGLLAQDLIDVVPWVVNAEDRTCWECRSGLRCARHHSFWHVDLDHMVPLLARGVQELTRRVTTLEHPGVYA